MLNQSGSGVCGWWGGVEGIIQNIYSMGASKLAESAYHQNK